MFVWGLWLDVYIHLQYMFFIVGQGRLRQQHKLLGRAQVRVWQLPWGGIRLLRACFQFSDVCHTCTCAGDPGCNGGDSCCSTSNLCKEGEGDCDSHSHFYFQVIVTPTFTFTFRWLWLSLSLSLSGDCDSHFHFQVIVTRTLTVRTIFFAARTTATSRTLDLRPMMIAVIDRCQQTVDNWGGKGNQPIMFYTSTLSRFF